MAGHIATAARQDWCTPEWILERVRKTFGGRIGLDPCWNSSAITYPRSRFTEKENGLIQSWVHSGGVFVNPPYGRGLAHWVKKSWESSTLSTPVIMLIPAAVGTKFWHRYIWTSAKAICFLKGRVKFIGAETGAPMDCALPYFTTGSVDDFCKAFNSAGKVVVLG